MVLYFLIVHIQLDRTRARCVILFIETYTILCRHAIIIRNSCNIHSNIKRRSYSGYVTPVQCPNILNHTLRSYKSRFNTFRFYASHFQFYILTHVQSYLCTILLITSSIFNTAQFQCFQLQSNIGQILQTLIPCIFNPTYLDLAHFHSILGQCSCFRCSQYYNGYTIPVFQ